MRVSIGWCPTGHLDRLGRLCPQEIGSGLACSSTASVSSRYCSFCTAGASGGVSNGYARVASSAPSHWRWLRSRSSSVSSSRSGGSFASQAERSPPTLGSTERRAMFSTDSLVRASGRSQTATSPAPLRSVELIRLYKKLPYF